MDEYRGELLPDGTVVAIDALGAEYDPMAMVGDGINDVPALATASVSVAMGAARSGTTIETADIALMSDDLGILPYLSALNCSIDASRIDQQRFGVVSVIHSELRKQEFHSAGRVVFITRVTELIRDERGSGFRSGRGRASRSELQPVGARPRRTP